MTRAEWQAEEGLWKVSVVQDGKARDEYAEVLISAQGVLLYVVPKKNTNVALNLLFL